MSFCKISGASSLSILYFFLVCAKLFRLTLSFRTRRGRGSHFSSRRRLPAGAGESRVLADSLFWWSVMHQRSLDMDSQLWLSHDFA